MKPLTSRLSNSEKYAVCKGFKYNDKDKQFKVITTKLDNLLGELRKNTKEQINDIFANYSVDRSLVIPMIEMNREISNPQLKIIGQIITFVENEVYSGDEYHDNREEQINCSKYWTDTYLPSTIQRNVYDKILDSSLKISNDKTNELAQILVTVSSQK